MLVYRSVHLTSAQLGHNPLQLNAKHLAFAIRESALLVGAQPTPTCSFARHLVGKIVIYCSFAHHDTHSPACNSFGEKMGIASWWNGVLKIYSNRSKGLEWNVVQVSIFHAMVDRKPEATATNFQ